MTGALPDLVFIIAGPGDVKDVVSNRVARVFLVTVERTGRAAGGVFWYLVFWMAVGSPQVHVQQYGPAVPNWQPLLVLLVWKQARVLLEPAGCNVPLNSNQVARAIDHSYHYVWKPAG